MKLTIDTEIFTPLLVNRLRERNEISKGDDAKTLQSLFDFQPHVQTKVKALVMFYGSVGELLKNIDGKTHHCTAVKCIAPMTPGGLGRRIWLVIDQNGIIREAVNTDNGEVPYGLPYDSMFHMDITAKEYKTLLSRFGKK